MVRGGGSCQGGMRGTSARVMTQKDERAERLAAALRENLKRRKARARGEQAEVDQSPPAEKES